MSFAGFSALWMGRGRKRNEEKMRDDMDQGCRVGAMDNISQGSSTQY